MPWGPLPFDRDQQRLLVALGAAAIVVALLVAVLALVRRDSTPTETEARAGEPTTTTVEGITTSTVDLVPSTSTTSTAPADEPTTTTAPPFEPGPPVGADGAVLAAPATTDTRVYTAAVGCRGAAEVGYTAECGVARAAGTDLLWLVERNDTTGGLRVGIYRPTEGNRWSAILTAIDDGPAGPTRFAAVTARVASVSGNGEQIVVGFRNQGSGAVLDIDIVDAPGRVVVHRTLEKGEARVRAGRVEDWSAEFSPDDALCCPSAWRHGVIEFVAGTWRLTSDRVETLSRPPDGDFE